jgi:methylphosphotriester-DNA--protein-cysteine methyltransferase
LQTSSKAAKEVKVDATDLKELLKAMLGMMASAQAQQTSAQEQALAVVDRHAESSMTTITNAFASVMESVICKSH